ncbi:DUF3299 domain-containing protein [Sphingobium algorifonticola]|uniref:DUF3299 domain-containing protein n=1 Tax=Sphingobium algorifonticola TaxID=2008318 RepID=A0A437J520_9SPHN|nr:DUF3299 domain-containing protein [Sphingobium algorifonticola]RVT39765.1 DUF3299 domain-containing protein [Sphingobium algorifonticola]
MLLIGRTILAIGLVTAGFGAGSAVLAQRPSNLQPGESVWKPAAAPPGGIPWSVLESTKEIQRQAAGIIYSRPAFSPRVKALASKRIKVSGYVMPLQNTAKQTHFVLLAYPPDCPFHLNPAPTQFIEVKTTSPIAVKQGVQSFEGTLILSGQDESGIFYSLRAGREI